MKNSYLLLIFWILSCSCVSHKSKEQKQAYEIESSLKIKLSDTDSTSLYELKIDPKFNTTDLQQYMYNQFGRWNNSIKLKDRSLDLLVWNNVKLFENRGELFTIGVSGDYKKLNTRINGRPSNWKLLYCSVVVFDSSNNDCFNPNSELKNKLTDYFIGAVKLVNKDDLSFKQVVKEAE